MSDIFEVCCDGDCWDGCFDCDGCCSCDGADCGICTWVCAFCIVDTVADMDEATDPANNQRKKEETAANGDAVITNEAEAATPDVVLLSMKSTEPEPESSNIDRA